MFFKPHNFLALISFVILVSCDTEATEVTTEGTSKEPLHFSKSAEVVISAAANEYSLCIADAFVEISEERFEEGKLPSLAKKLYIEKCESKKALFKSEVEAAAIKHPNTSKTRSIADFSESFAKSIEDRTFQILYDEIQPPS
ncbi:hypothetical protein ROLI_010680 [Roseobacter fucihabitans]|uniref:Lipoprotein n=1 Tax=Roseobacter fucihabitans TaxID=1537242 RepID=A0ABZ2BQ58_9RHOB|nr:hypothetical protein [Roseobacter litoralis]MBC6964868.1 hypothetical protein [Roseobacter litoralis]MBC6965528.1 hypothetical protein [Roseobacter litoralis]